MQVDNGYARAPRLRRAVSAGRYAAALLAALAVSALAAAHPSSAGAQTSPLGVALTVEDRPLTVGDPLVLTISAVYPDGYHVIFPRLPREWGSFEVRSQAPQATVVNEDLTRTAKQVIEVALFAPGDHQTPAISVSFRGPDGGIVERSVRPATVHVSSVLDQRDQELRDIGSQADISVPSLWPWTVSAAALGILGLAAFVLWRRGSPVGLLAADGAEPQTPFQLAMGQLDHIEELDLPSRGLFKDHYSLVTDVVRRYLHREYNLTTPDRTTSETDLALRASAIPPPQGREIVEVLQDGDLVKFSEIVPGQEPSWEAVHRTRAVIQAIKPQEPEPDTPGPDAAEGQ